MSSPSFVVAFQALRALLSDHATICRTKAPLVAADAEALVEFAAEVASVLPVVNTKPEPKAAAPAKPAVPAPTGDFKLTAAPPKPEAAKPQPEAKPDPAPTANLKLPAEHKSPKPAAPVSSPAPTTPPATPATPPVPAVLTYTQFANLALAVIKGWRSATDRARALTFGAYLASGVPAVRFLNAEQPERAAWLNAHRAAADKTATEMGFPAAAAPPAKPEPKATGPTCNGTNATGDRKGQPCEGRRMKGSNYCRRHQDQDPTRQPTPTAAAAHNQAPADVKSGGVVTVDGKPVDFLTWAGLNAPAGTVLIADGKGGVRGVGKQDIATLAALLAKLSA